MRRGEILAPLALFSLFLLGGCESCRRATEQPERVPATATPPASPVPTRGPESGEEAAYEEEADCIVLADANPDFGPPPLRVQFEAEYECYEDTTVRLRWDFGDGSSSEEQNPVHTYERTGEYLAKVVLTTPDGRSTEDEIDILVEEEDPL